MYTPVNPEFPAARVERMREAGGIVFALADAECAGRAREAFAGACLDLSTLPLAGSGMSLPAPGGRDAAYMLREGASSDAPFLYPHLLPTPRRPRRLVVAVFGGCMLQNIRDNSQGWIAKTIIGVIIVLLSLTGFDAIIRATDGVQGSRRGTPG